MVPLLIFYLLTIYKILGVKWTDTHSTQDIDHELTNMFKYCLMEHTGPWRWPASTSDLTPLDFFLRSCIKNQVYATPVHSRKKEREEIWKKEYEQHSVD